MLFSRLSTLLLFSLLALCTALAPDKNRWKKPDFCGKLECPPFKLADDRESYEIRTYEKGHWVHINVTDKKYETAYVKGAAALLKYFKGDNEDEKHMEITTPTLAAIKMSKDAQETEREYIFSMWIDPAEFKEEPPKPKNEDLEVKEYDEITVYSRQFGGFATENSILQEANALHHELADDDEEFDQDMVFVAVYDPAVKLLNRHNEVHVEKKAGPPSSFTFYECDDGVEEPVVAVT